MELQFPACVITYPTFSDKTVGEFMSSVSSHSVYFRLAEFVVTCRNIDTDIKQLTTCTRACLSNAHFDIELF